MTKISIWIWNFYYYNYSLLECLEHLKQFKNISWIEIVVKHDYIFNKKEISELSKYKYNTLHLLGFNKNDIDWMLYCIKTIPNFKHFVLHPDSAILKDLNKDIESYISFENMDTRKPSHQTPEEMLQLFKKYPESSFTFDINHAEENNISYEDFNIVKHPEQIHFSVVNKKYYKNYPEINTPHALASLEEWFNFNLKKYKNSIITIEWVFIPWKNNLIEKEILLVKQLLS